ncbi:MAG: hypothetical protein ACRD4H_12080 [Candidatus Acidiferrales bacterium]
MELLLNLFWLISALIAVGSWWYARGEQRCHRLPQLVVLSCVLILLFPVISVTDDLHPIRPELEESSPSKKIKTAAHASSSPSGVFDSSPAHVACTFSFSPHSRICGQVLPEPAPVPETALLCKDACRAPPAPALS